MSKKQQEKEKFLEEKNNFEQELNSLALEVFSPNPNKEKIAQIFEENMKQYSLLHAPYSFYNMSWASNQLKKLYANDKANTHHLTYPANFNHWSHMTNDKGERVRVKPGTKALYILKPNIIKKRIIKIPKDNPNYDELIALSKKNTYDEKLNNFAVGEITTPALSFTPVKVFDVSQTNAVEIGAIKAVDWDKLAENNEIKNKAYEKILDFLINYVEKNNGIKVVFDDKNLATNGLQGFYNGKEIHVQEALPINLKLSTFTHELGHHLADHLGEKEYLDTNFKEVQADIFSYILTNKLKIENETRMTHIVTHLMSGGILKNDELIDKNNNKQVAKLRANFNTLMKDITEPYNNFLKESKFSTFIEKEIFPMIKSATKEDNNIVKKIENEENLENNIKLNI